MARQVKLGFVTFLTVVRFPLVLAFFAGALVNNHAPRPALFVGSLLLLVLAAVTDLFDGYFARRFEVRTHLGAHMDPLMDKFFYLSTLPLLTYLACRDGNARHAVFLLVLTLLFLSRDQWVTFLRAIGSMYGAGGAADWSGKLRTAVNFPMLCAVYLVEESPWALPPAAWTALVAFESLALAINLVSIYTYTRRYWPCLRQAGSLDHAPNAALNAPADGVGAPPA
jgi:CDP-diacylglycerol--glycerol-3-phosphate 3-phosphatidyltransferase